MNGALTVWTYRDGLLARLAHDLRLSVAAFAVTAREGRVVATFDPASARVDGVVRGNQLDATGLSAADARSIQAAIRETILGPEPVRFEGRIVEGAPPRVAGTLTLRGRAAPFEAPLTVRPQALACDAELVPTRWGIAPYRALGGAIRLQDRWRVRLTLPYEGGPPSALTGAWIVPSGIG